MQGFISIFSFLLVALLSNFAVASDVANHEYIPVGIMNHHVHKKNEFMASYTYQDMQMSGMTDDGKNKSTQDVLTGGYMMVPETMSMRMHMFDLMYGATDKLTLAVMGSYLQKSMTSMHDSAHNYKVADEHANGIGDTKIHAMYAIGHGRNKLNVSLGISLPTGSIEQADHHGNRAGYNMQTGSGSYELLPSLVYSSSFGGYSYGGQIDITRRLNNNKFNYKFGDQYHATAWVSKALHKNIAGSLRVDYTNSKNINGVDSDVDVMDSPTNNGSFYAGNVANIFAGVDFVAQNGMLAGYRFVFEGGLPVYQKLDGMQMKRGSIVTFGIQKYIK